METPTEFNQIGESETNYNRSGVDNALEVKIDTIESTAEIAEVSRKEGSDTETVNALIEGKCEEQGADGEENGDHNEIDVEEEVRVLTHSDNCEKYNMVNVESKEPEANGKSVELEPTDNITPTQEADSEDGVQPGINENFKGEENTEGSIHVTTNATALVVEISEAQDADVGSPQDKGIRADGFHGTECAHETTNEPLLSNNDTSSQGVLETSAEFKIKGDAYDASILSETDNPAASTEMVMSNTQTDYDYKVVPASKQDDGEVTVEASLGQQEVRSEPPLDVPQHVTDQSSCSKTEQIIGADTDASTNTQENPMLIEENICGTQVENNLEEIAQQNVGGSTELSTNSTNALSKTADTENSNRESPSEPELFDSVAIANVGNVVIHVNNSLSDTHEISTEQTEDEVSTPENNMSEVLNENIVKLTEAKLESMSESSSGQGKAHDADQITSFSEMSTETATDVSSVSADTTPESQTQREIIVTGDKMKNQPQLEKETTKETFDCVVIASEFNQELSSCTNSNLKTETAELSNLSETVVLETTVIKTEIIEKKSEKSDDVGALVSRINCKDVSQKDEAENDEKKDKSAEIAQDATVTVKDNIHPENDTPSNGNEEKGDEEEVAKSKTEDKKASPSNEEAHESKVESNAGDKNEEPILEKTDVKRSQGCCVIS